MNQEETIAINVHFELLTNYFYFDSNTLPEYTWEKQTIYKKHHDQVKDLLTEFNIYDQEAIDNFSYLVKVWREQSIEAKAREQDFINSQKVFKNQLFELYKLVEFFKDNNVTSIQFSGNPKTGTKFAKSTKLQNYKSIEKVMESLSDLINRTKRTQELKIFSKRMRGAEDSIHGNLIRDTFERLRKFLNDSPFNTLNDLSDRQENTFAGKLFVIAGVIEPFNEDLQYKSENDYLVKMLNKYR